MKARLEKDRKFWAVETDDGTGEVNIRFGRIGTNGQLHTIPRPNDRGYGWELNEANRRLNAKVREGYMVVNATDPIEHLAEDRSMEEGIAISLTKAAASKLADAHMAQLAHALGLRRDQHGSITDERGAEGIYTVGPMAGGWAKDPDSIMGTLLTAIAWKTGQKVANMDDNEEQSPAARLKMLPRELHEKLVAIGFAPAAMKIDTGQAPNPETGWSMTVL